MPNSIQTYLKRAGDAYQKRSFAEAISHLHEALRLDPKNIDVLQNLGALHDQTQEFDQAASYYRKALDAAPDNTVVRRGLASLLFDLGEHDESRALYADLVRADPTDVDAHFAYSRLTTYQQDDTTLGALDLANESVDGLLPDEQIRLYFTIGKARQDLGDYDLAYQAFSAGNRLHYAQHPYDEASNYAMLEDLQSCFDSDYFGLHPVLENDDSSPIFVLGMPRSGSTLVEQILASHSQVATAGEVKYLQRCLQKHLIRDSGTFSNAIASWSRQALQDTASDYLELLRRHSDGEDRVVDKLPGNYAFIGLIRLLFPNAYIIHTFRHPMATIWSNYSTHFGDALYYTYNLDVLCRYYKKYVANLSHWQNVFADQVAFDLEYETLIKNAEGTVRSLLEYLDLPWEPQCLEFYKSKRLVKTASVAQVRQPLYSGAIEMWRNYRKQLRHTEEEFS